MAYLFMVICVALVVFVIGSQRRIERRLESIERHLGARPGQWS